MTRSLLIHAAACIALAAWGEAAQAALISGSAQITPTTSIIFGTGTGANAPFGSLSQIVDGIDLNSDVSPWNGYAPNATSGLITLTLNQPYNLTAFLLANDVRVQGEGVKNFTLSFYDSSSNLLTVSGTLTAQKATVPAQQYTFAEVSAVKSVGLNVLDVYTSNPTRIEIREVAFIGEPVFVPEPSTIGLVLSSFACSGWVALRRPNR